MFSLKNKTVIVTGATGHLGRAICISLAEHEADIAVCSTTQANADAFAEKLGDKVETTCKGYELDLQNIESMRVVVEKIVSDFGSIDCLINNAHFGEQCTIDDVTPESWDKGLDGTITSTVFMVQQCITHLERVKGNIINIASMYGMVSPDPDIYIDQAPNPMNYGVGKAAVIQYTKYAAVHLANKNIRVNSISPGAFPNVKVQRNKQFIKKLKQKIPIKRIGEPEDISGSVVFLASDAANYITGHNLVVDGGWTIW
jgi:gluconate 5-dehydrogenase